ncbi:MAG: hypothetical protein ACRC6M_06895 [Microcystaceae cyanobacterium]
MEQLTAQLALAIATGQALSPLGLPLIGVWLRNLAFLAIVLAHEF